MLTKKQIKMIAKIIKTQVGYDDYTGNDFEQGWDGATKRIACRFADYLAVQNPSFDRGKFLKACGLPSEL